MAKGKKQIKSKIVGASIAKETKETEVAALKKLEDAKSKKVSDNSTKTKQTKKEKSEEVTFIVMIDKKKNRDKQHLNFYALEDVFLNVLKKLGLKVNDPKFPYYGDSELLSSIEESQLPQEGKIVKLYYGISDITFKVLDNEKEVFTSTVISPVSNTNDVVAVIEVIVSRKLTEEEVKYVDTARLETSRKLSNFLAFASAQCVSRYIAEPGFTEVRYPHIRDNINNLVRFVEEPEIYRFIHILSHIVNKLRESEDIRCTKDNTPVVFRTSDLDLGHFNLTQLFRLAYGFVEEDIIFAHTTVDTINDKPTGLSVTVLSLDANKDIRRGLYYDYELDTRGGFYTINIKLENINKAYKELINSPFYLEEAVGIAIERFVN